jgi:hypothetical protein
MPLGGSSGYCRPSKAHICLAAVQPKHPGQFNFPHFYLLGFPKCATTSLFQ